MAQGAGQYISPHPGGNDAPVPRSSRGRSRLRSPFPAVPIACCYGRPSAHPPWPPPKPTSSRAGVLPSSRFRSGGFSMAKELVIASNRHEIKVAVLEDDQLVEVSFQRSNEYSLAGSIHKGRVTRVLPGMQSAFVDLGLDRDCFLYVSDFFEENEEYDKLADER